MRSYLESAIFFMLLFKLLSYGGGANWDMRPKNLWKVPNNTDLIKQISLFDTALIMTIPKVSIKECFPLHMIRILKLIRLWLALKRLYRKKDFRTWRPKIVLYRTSKIHFISIIWYWYKKKKISYCTLLYKISDHNCSIFFFFTICPRSLVNFSKYAQ